MTLTSHASPKMKEIASLIVHILQSVYNVTTKSFGNQELFLTPHLKVVEQKYKQLCRKKRLPLVNNQVSSLMDAAKVEWLEEFLSAHFFLSQVPPLKRFCVRYSANTKGDEPAGIQEGTWDALHETHLRWIFSQERRGYHIVSIKPIDA